MKRHYFISDSLDDLERVEIELEQGGLIKPQIHVLSDNESEISEHVEDPMSITHELAHLARSDTDPSSTDEYTTSDETDSENDEEADDDNNLTELTRGVEKTTRRQGT